jgi:NADP-dependent 3-hydroxy acid dehydrogenase YdfG
MAFQGKVALVTGAASGMGRLAGTVNVTMCCPACSSAAAAIS